MAVDCQSVTVKAAFLLWLLDLFVAFCASPVSHISLQLFCVKASNCSEMCLSLYLNQYINLSHHCLVIVLHEFPVVIKVFVQYDRCR